MDISKITQALDKSCGWLDLNIPQGYNIKLANASNCLKAGLDYVLSRRNIQFKWLPEYDQVADWLTDNKGKGLLMIGNCGNGKSLLGRYVIPLILNAWHTPKICVTSKDMTKVKDTTLLLQHTFLSLDDVGTEDVVNDYGNKSLPFAELVDNAEKTGHILIISTNLTGEQLAEKYGVRIVDRLASITRKIEFNNESLR